MKNDGVAKRVDPRGQTVAEMAAASGVSAHTLRYYEHAGLIESVGRNAGNQRRYSEADVEWVKFLLRLRETGMSISRMRQYAELRAQGTGTVADRLALLQEHQKVLREQIATLRRHERALETKIAIYRHDLAEQSGDRNPDDGANHE
ncbi:MerR family transcriptional regulator [Williamsia sp.]|uniref:MerR family transcriptional regulator n=1 Tax=Williamsia sp. TaxID=1872085 RepID=UPI002F93634E